MYWNCLGSCHQCDLFEDIRPDYDLTDGNNNGAWT